MGRKRDVCRVNPYSNSVLHTLDEICLFLLRLGRLPLDEILSALGPTTIERKRIWRWIFSRMLLLPLMCVLLCLSMPFVLTGTLVWLSFQHKKTPYRISIKQRDVRNFARDQTQFSFATANVCLMQQCLCRFNNQKDPSGRATKQGQRFVENQNLVAAASKLHNIAGGDSSVLQRNGFSAKSAVDHRVLDAFPRLDMLLLQVYVVCIRDHDDVYKSTVLFIY